jgi:spore coat protein A
VTLTRRNLLRIAAGAITLPALSSCSDDGSTAGSTGAQQASSARLPKRFTVPLPVPPVLKPTSTDGGIDRYDIVQRAAKVEILPGLTTEIWGYNGLFPGPTIRSRRGRQVVVRHRNDLSVPVAVHLHGGKNPPESDGYPTDLVLPARGWSGDHPHGGRVETGAKEYVYPLDQPAATLWYHDHRMDFTGPQVYRGLAGFHLVTDDEEAALPLPGGERDIPLMICDRSFHEDGSFRYPSLDPELADRAGVTHEFMKGVLGDVILVNGAPWPVLEVTAARYRFRLLNASNARRYKLTLDPPPPEGAAFTQIGSDAGLLGRPQPLDEIPIAGAERFDVVVDFSRYPPGTKITLRNTAASGPAGEVMRFDVVRTGKDDSTVPTALVDFEPLSRSSATTTRKFDFNQRNDDGWDINGKVFDPDRDDAQPRLGATEIWKFDGDADHPIHLHLAHFQVLSRNGNDPRPADAGWKDTVDLQSGKEIEVIARFTGYRGRYVFHCHNLEHEDMGMMANLRVV